MKIDRKSKYLRARINNNLSKVFGPGMRTVEDYCSVRFFLDECLSKAEKLLELNCEKVKLMPYVAVITNDQGQQVFPVGVNRGYYSKIRNLINHGNPEDELGTMNPGTLRVAYIESLREFDIAGCGFLIDKELQASIFSKRCACCGDKTFEINGEHYGPYTSKKLSLLYDGDERDCYENREGLEQNIQTLFEVSQSVVFVTLGPGDDIEEIVMGNKYFDGHEWQDK